MVRYQIILAYDGSPFQGFQRQGQRPGQVPTVQDAVETALKNLGWQGHSILAAGRTDTGVHAIGQVISFDLDWQHSPDDLLHALNAHLPAEIAAQSINIVSPEFHPRYDANARSYCYHVFQQPMRHPLLERYAWRVWPSLKIDYLHQAAELFIGTHDFAAFGTPPRVGGSTERIIYRSEWLDQNGILIFTVVANAFLYHMVRRIVFVQVAAAQERIDVSTIAQALQKPLEMAGGFKQGLAPPQGLVLTEVSYPASLAT